MRESDLELARRWLLEPHVRRWWNDDPSEADYPDGTLAEWRAAIRGEDPTDMFVIKMDGTPIGAIQSYRVGDYPEYVEETGVREPAISVDVFIAKPDLIGKGHGPALLRVFVRDAFARYGIDYCVIGPARSNVAAIRAYEKAGFHYLKDYREEDTIDPEHVLLGVERAELG